MDLQRETGIQYQITLALILTLPDNAKPYCVEADSLDFATGAILSQESPEDGKWHPVAFLSKSLSPVERNYEIMLCFRNHVNFITISDHQHYHNSDLRCPQLSTALPSIHSDIP